MIFLGDGFLTGNSCVFRGFNPSENISQNGNLPQIGVKIKVYEITA